MVVFNNEIINLLPGDGMVNYYGKVLPLAGAVDYFNLLFESIEWKNDEAIIFGKHIITKRKAAWYGDTNYLYTYSRTTKQAIKWTPELLILKQFAEQLTGSSYNSCLLNLYHDGNEGVGWHSDDEKSLVRHSPIAVLSFGAERNFLLRHKETKQLVSIVLERGSLLVMKGNTQTNWVHCLPKSKKISAPRISLTFRTIVNVS